MDKLSLGLTVAKTVVITSEIYKQTTLSTTAAPFADSDNNTYSDKRSYPYQVTAGVSFFPNSSLLLSGDLSYNSAFEYTYEPLAKVYASI